jgi:excisionase family DNA binding protein
LGQIEPLMTVSEVAAVLRVGRFRVYELVRLGMIPCIRVGRQLRFSPTDLGTWFRGGGKELRGGWRKEPLSHGDPGGTPWDR